MNFENTYFNCKECSERWLVVKAAVGTIDCPKCGSNSVIEDPYYAEEGYVEPYIHYSSGFSRSGLVRGTFNGKSFVGFVDYDRSLCNNNNDHKWGYELVEDISGAYGVVCDVCGMNFTDLVMWM